MRAQYEVDWGHLAFVLVMAGAVVWYLLDTVSISISTNNLLFVAPVGGLALLLCLLVIPQCFRPAGAKAEPSETASITGKVQGESPSGKWDLLRIGGVSVSLVFLVALLNPIGFDGAILLFSGAVMWICGERKLLPLIIYPLVVTLVIVLGFRAILPFPMHTIVL
jgi:hypothetical protein